MNDMVTKLSARVERKSNKRDDKKKQIAESALEALKVLGYANTSLRDIAENSGLSLGMLHYYFEDKSDLIIHCVSIYKKEFVAEMTAALEMAEGRDEVIAHFAEALTVSIVDRESTHRLWYDIRNQAMFDVSFRPIVDELEGNLIDIVALAMRGAGSPPTTSRYLTYALLDGLFRLIMQDRITEKEILTRDEVFKVFHDLLGQLL